MSDEPKVEVVSEPGKESQFGRRRRMGFRGLAQKASGHLTLIFSIGFVTCVSWLIFGGKPKKDGVDHASRFLDIQVPPAQTLGTIFNISPVGGRAVATQTQSVRTGGFGAAHSPDRSSLAAREIFRFPQAPWSPPP